jgi:sigma-B regulation protein RsbQ
MPPPTTTLHGYAADLLDIMEAFCDGPSVYVGHSVGSMIGLLAGIRRPERFAAQVMVGPSPRYIDDGAYTGGFAPADIEDLLDAMAGNYLGWSSSMAPSLMGAVHGAALGGELADAFSSSDPDIARHFAAVTFLSDHRADLPLSTTPTLILQSTEAHIAGSELAVIANVGHYPHMSAPGASVDAITAFLQRHAL